MNKIQNPEISEKLENCYGCEASTKLRFLNSYGGYMPACSQEHLTQYENNSEQ